MGDELITGGKFIIASESGPRRLLFGQNNPRVGTSDEILSLKEIPPILIIVGDVIGMELAGIFVTWEAM